MRETVALVLLLVVFVAIMCAVVHDRPAVDQIGAAVMQLILRQR